jgi:hypothetical protein
MSAVAEEEVTRFYVSPNSKKSVGDECQLLLQFPAAFYTTSKSSLENSVVVQGLPENVANSSTKQLNVKIAILSSQFIPNRVERHK